MALNHPWRYDRPAWPPCLVNGFIDMIHPVFRMPDVKAFIGRRNQLSENHIKG
jgi:hypothetical protein